MAWAISSFCRILFEGYQSRVEEYVEWAYGGRYDIGLSVLYRGDWYTDITTDFLGLAGTFLCCCVVVMLSVYLIFYYSLCVSICGFLL